MTPSERAAAGLRAYWRTQCGYVAGGEVATYGGLLATATRLPDETLNCAFASGPVDDPVGAVDWFVGWFRSRGLRPGIELAAGHPLEAEVARRGFTVVVRRPAMTRSVDVPSVTVPRVRVTRVASEADLASYRAIQAAVFDLTPEVADGFLPARALDVPGVVWLLGWYDDVPCATSAVVVSEHGAGVVGVATLAAYRRRGLGRAVTAAAVAEGASLGADLAWLYPTAMAKPLYEGLGFVTHDDVQVWVAPAGTS